MSTKGLLALSAFALAPGIAAAQESFDYRFLEISFVDAQIDDSNVDGDGFRLEGSYNIGDSFFARAEYEDYDFDFGIDANMFELGGGYVHSMSSDFDFVGTAQFVQVEVENFDDDGVGIGGGIRTRLADAFEVDLMLNWVDFDQSGSDSYLDLRGRYLFTDRLAGTLKFDVGSDYFETLSLGVRFGLN